MNNGYIKIHRKFLDWEWYSNINDCRLFIHCLFKANWKDGYFEGILIPRGSFATSISNLAKETGLTVQQVRTSLKHLNSTSNLTNIRHSKFSIISINNYEKYQVNNKVDNNQLTINQQTDNNQITTIEEYKESNKEISSSSYILGEQHKEILNILTINGFIYSNTPEEFNIIDYLSKVDKNVVKNALEIANIKNKMDLNYILGIVINKLKQKQEYDKNKKQEIELPKWFDKKIEKDTTNLEELEELLKFEGDQNEKIRNDS